MCFPQHGSALDQMLLYQVLAKKAQESHQQFPTSFLNSQLSRGKQFHKQGAKANEKKPKQHYLKSAKKETSQRGSWSLFKSIGVPEFSVLCILGTHTPEDISG